MDRINKIIFFGKKGYTFIEVMMTVLIFSMIMGGLYAGLTAGNRSWQAYDMRAVAQREARRTFIYLERDLRMAENLSFKKNTDREVVFSFQHPDQGLVTYAWARLDREPAGTLYRSVKTSSRIIARQVSALKVAEESNTITFDITTAADGHKDHGSEVILRGLVTKR